jgi:hypothetical protein
MSDERTPTAEPVTAREVLLAYGNGWHGANCEGNFRMDAACSCELERWVDAIEAEAAQRSTDLAGALRWVRSQLRYEGGIKDPEKVAAVIDRALGEPR